MDAVKRVMGLAGTTALVLLLLFGAPTQAVASTGARLNGPQIGSAPAVITSGKGGNAVIAASPCVNVHTGPSLASPVLTCVPYDYGVDIGFSQTGDWVYGLWGPTNCWDYLTEFGGFASDGFIYTGQSEC